VTAFVSGRRDERPRHWPSRHGEDLQLQRLATQHRSGFIPIALRFHAPVVGLGHTGFALDQPQLQPSPAHVGAYRALAGIKPRYLDTQPTVAHVRAAVIASVKRNASDGAAMLLSGTFNTDTYPRYRVTGGGIVVN